MLFEFLQVKKIDKIEEKAFRFTILDIFCFDWFYNCAIPFTY